MAKKLSIILLLIYSLSPATGWTEGRHIAIIIDTSGSMSGSDKPRYTVQLSQIISELVDKDDKLDIIHLGGSTCSAGPSSSLVLPLNQADRNGFKQQLDQMITYSGGNDFAAPIRTAIQLLSYDRNKQRMLLIIADSGGLDCDESWDELTKLHDSGAIVAAINIGSNAGAFDTSPAFDFTTAALDSEKLVAAVAQIYQKFLGAKQVQTGVVQQSIEIQIAPFVTEAFLVIAADGTVNALQQMTGNPPAKHIALNHSKGQTTGQDGRTRHYQIARLESPASGHWRFKVPGLSDKAGWMLIQDSAISVRFISPPVIAKGRITPIEIELYDKKTGQRITDPSRLTGLDLQLNIEGQKVRFNDDGIEGDRKPRDGILTGQVTFNKIGKQQITAHLQSDFLDRKISLKTEIIETAWKLEITSPSKAEISSPVTLSVRLHPIGRLSDLTPPKHIEVITGDVPVILRDNGDVYSGTWTPFDLGKRQLHYIPIGGTRSAPIDAEIEIIGSLKFGKPVPIDLGQLRSHATKLGIFDLSTAEIKGHFQVQISTDYAISGTALEIDTGEGWIDLDNQPVKLQLNQGDNLIWPLRLRTGRCPAGSPANEKFKLIVESLDKTQRSEIILSVEIFEEPWLTCWWPVIAIVIGGLFLMFVIYGIISPTRFSPRLGVVLSPEEDINEGFFHPIRAQRGTGSGFYRDARVYICQDFRLSNKPSGALARLRAHDHIQPVGGNTLSRQTADGKWENLPPEETKARFGVVYKDEMGTLFFEIRNG
jgi:hypothetical protein